MAEHSKPHCQLALESPRTITKRIESYVARDLSRPRMRKRIRRHKLEIGLRSNGNVQGEVNSKYVDQIEEKPEQRRAVPRRTVRKRLDSGTRRRPSEVVHLDGRFKVVCFPVIKPAWPAKWVLSCTDNGHTSSTSSVSLFLRDTRTRSRNQDQDARGRPSVSSLPVSSKPPSFSLVSSTPPGDTSCCLISRTCAEKIVRENRVICPGGVNSGDLTLLVVIARPQLGSRGARNEERRAQKALLLLKARDQQISLLERRVAQLENAAADMHAITLQVQIPTPEISDKTSYFSIPQESLTTPESQEVIDSVERKDLDRDQNGRFGEIGKQEKKLEEGQQAIHVPELKFSSSPLSDSENDVFSTPVSPGSENDRVEKHKNSSENACSAVISDETVYFLRNESPKSTSSKQTSVDTLPRGISGEHVHQMNSTGVKEPDKELTKTCNVNVEKNILSQISDNNCSLTLLMAAAALLQSKEITDIKQPNDEPRFDNAGNQRSGRKVNGSSVSFNKLELSRPVKLSPSVPWVSVKRRLRRKSRGHELGLGTKAEAILRAKDIRREQLGFDFTSKSLSAVNGTLLNPAIDNTDHIQHGDVVVRSLNPQEVPLARLTLRSDHETVPPPSNKHVIIQTAPVKINEPSGFELLVQQRENDEFINSENFSRTNLRQDRKSSKYSSAEDEPAPQWLIEKALNRGREMSVINRYDKRSAEMIEEISSLKTKYEKIIFHLEEKYNDVKDELERAHKKKYNLREKFKRALRNTKMEAIRENEILQEKIVQICGSVLEKFGPYAFDGRKVNSRGKKSHKACKRFRKLSKKLNRKLRSALVMSNKLRDELTNTKKVLEDKTRQHESLDRRFTRLKQELETTELNLNDLINENSSLRKKFEDTREWMELKIGKDRNERNNFIQLKDMQKSRDIINLKKKADEDFTTITQLRNKLLRSESANANKGFLLNSYKGQLADLAKEKDQLISKSKEVENDLSQFRNTNAQLKAKISLLLNEKEKLVSKNENSEHDSKEKMETKLTSKYEKSMLQEIDSMKLKCDELLEVMRDRLNVAENCSSEYSTAISQFLRQLNSHVSDSEMDSSFGDGEASHREAHQTACTILDMTPKELSGFMKGQPTNKMNTWLSDVRKITSRNNFSDALANYLFKKVFSSV